jgi:ribonucleoside-triphosphate reductase
MTRTKTTNVHSKFAYLYAKTVTLIPTHDERTNAVMLRNRRIGMSQSGVMQSIAKHGLRNHFDWCDKGYAYTQKLDELYSEWLCIPRSVKMTSVKPSGTVSLLAGATPGIHASYGEYYWRTVRFEKSSPLVTVLREAGYRIFDTQLASTCVVLFSGSRRDEFLQVAQRSHDLGTTRIGSADAILLGR